MAYDPVKQRAYYLQNRDKILSKRRGKKSPQNARIQERNKEIKNMSAEQLLYEVGYYTE